ncbi:MFS transporter [Streptomyces sp. NBC_00882]|uniref:MFS transporter n=1 Tax=Streptomyces TaxID=1883 RepID=UPI0038641F10|nr:MFS transporter [Streptomyces sp. NBC_00882]WSZ56989.1 MFS transporter [Streptomyces canus]
MTKTWAVFHDRNARLFLTAVTVSGFGTSALWLVSGVWVKDLTGSDGLAALCMLAMWAPTLAGPLLGTLADRVPRKPLLIAGSLLLAALLPVLFAVDGRDRVWLVLTVLCVYGAAGVVHDAAESALVAGAVPPSLLGGFNGLRMAVTEGMKLVAPLAGAGLYAVQGGPGVALLDAITFVLAALLYAGLRVRESRPGPLAPPTSTGSGDEPSGRTATALPSPSRSPTATSLPGLSRRAAAAPKTPGLGPTTPSRPRLSRRAAATPKAPDGPTTPSRPRLSRRTAATPKTPGLGPTTTRRRTPSRRTPAGAGARHIWAHPILRPLVLAGGTTMFFAGVNGALIYAVIDGLGHSPAYAGALYAAQGAGSLAVGLVSGPALRRLGERRFAAYGIALTAVAAGLRAIPSDPLALVCSAAIGGGLPCVLIAALTAVQRETPDMLLGRAVATAHTLMYTPNVLGLAAGAALVELVDQRPLSALLGVAWLATAVPLFQRPASASRIASRSPSDANPA